jgi:hypothetical protein
MTTQLKPGDTIYHESRYWKLVIRLQEARDVALRGY